MARVQPMNHRNEQPAYAAATQELSKLQSALVPVVGRIRELELLLASHQPEDERISGHAEAAMHFAETGTVRRSDTADTWREEHMLLRQQAEALQQLIDKKQQALYQLESQLSANALTGAKADFDDIRVRYIAKLKELDAIAGEEQALLSALNSAGYYPSLPNPVAWPLIGVLSDPQSAISAQVRDLTRR